MSLERFKSIMLVILIVILVIFAVILRVNLLDDSVHNGFPDVTTTPNVNNVETNVPITTATPNVPIVTVTTTASVPNITQTPEVWYFVTVVPTTKVPPTVSPTNKPPEEVLKTPVPPTNVPTKTPPDITSTPVVTNTNTPTIAPTSTPIPTKIPVVYDENAFNNVENELSKLAVGNEILPEYDSNKTYDLYKYISINNIDPYKLFNSLQKIYIDVIAHSFDFSFDYGNNIEGIHCTLESAYCEQCGKLKCVYKRENDTKMTWLLSDVKDVEKVNVILMEFLYSNTIAGNFSERLFICCSCNN